MLTLAILLFAAAGCGSESKKEPASANGESSSPSDTTAACDYQKDGSEAARKVSTPPKSLDEEIPEQLILDTNMGKIKLTLDTKNAPCTVNNFYSLAKQGYFDDTRCHRLVDNAPGQTDGTLFVLQCGDPTATGRGGPGYTFADELIENDPRLQPCEDYQGTQVCTYTKGTVAMANAGPGTNGSQFFLVFDNSRLPNSYTVFAHMDAAGIKVVKEIAKGGFDASNPNTPPMTETTIKSVS
jgi:peptidyl-prolyl cis-trans isomerase B (cyclophilin B)